MSSIAGVHASPAASYVAPKPAAAKPEGQESAQTERNEATSGTGEVGEAAAGGRFSVIA